MEIILPTHQELLKYFQRVDESYKLTGTPGLGHELKQQDITSNPMGGVREHFDWACG